MREIAIILLRTTIITTNTTVVLVVIMDTYITHYTQIMFIYYYAGIGICIRPF